MYKIGVEALSSNFYVNKMSFSHDLTYLLPLESPIFFVIDLIIQCVSELAYEWIGHPGEAWNIFLFIIFIIFLQGISFFRSSADRRVTSEPETFYLG